ncbi:HDOD domain-containing protein [Pseudoduganella violacea]|uniref:HD-like signal output (HDOD) protein n=1 Tax=Pseudoduganella violacea TaxID=1715466 RepID=A0A7W5FWI5_9BURK|nr:HDOD domain-containing protein [Pseudoduganella violacea]MBB3121313.1 HD-like signal output (HDOD) protein [Pseudoduganella violacea]
MYQWLRRLLSGSAAASEAAAPPAAAARAVHAPAPAVAHPPAAAPPGPPTPAPAAEIAPPPPSPIAAVLETGVPSFDQKDAINSAYCRWLFATYGKDELDTNQAEERVLATLLKMSRQHSAADMMRRMPGLIPQVLQSLRSEQFAGAEIARKISSDVVLVAAVIRLANHAIHHSGQGITSVEHAIMVIGQEGLRQLITTVAFRPIINLNSGYYTKLLAPRIWEQSERCAVAARMLAPPEDVEPFDAFLTGLVQNAGLLATLRVMDQIGGESRALGSALFCARLQGATRQIAAGVAQEWHFPPSVAEAILEQELMRRGSAISPLGRVLARADYLSKARIMAEQGQIAEDDPSLFDGLPPAAQRCYATLHTIPEADT